MRAGIIAGSATAVAAVLLSLPLHAPSDTLFNSASAAAGAVAAGVIAGLLWGALPAGPLRLPRFAAAEAALFAVTAVALVASETQLERMVEFGLPLAIVLVGEGDERSGTLSLPAPAAAAASARTPTPAPSPASPAAAAASPSPSPSPAATAAAPITLAVNSHVVVAGVTFVVGEGSEVTFTVNEQLSRLPLPNDAVVRTDALSGSIHLDGRPSVVEIDLRQLESDQSRRDQYIHNRMFRSDPIATLTFDELPALPQSYTPGELFEGEISGRLLILGAEYPLTFTVEARIDPDALLVLGRTTFTWDQIADRACPAMPLGGGLGPCVALVRGRACATRPLTTVRMRRLPRCLATRGRGDLEGRARSLRPHVCHPPLPGAQCPELRLRPPTASATPAWRAAGPSRAACSARGAPSGRRLPASTVGGQPAHL